MLNEILKKRGIKKKWLAEKVGVTAATMTKISRKESLPNLKVALKIAQILELKVEDIWGYLINSDNNEK